MGRERNKKMTVYFTEKEKEIIKKNVEISGCRSFEQYALKMLSKGQVIEVNTDGLDKLTYEVNKIGVNINQIAHKVNAADVATVEAINEAKASLKRIEDFVRIERRKASIFMEG